MINYVYKRRRKMNKTKKTNLKDVRGITLIALVITIIVLLILAAVSIATLTGENGILTKAKTAKEETEKAAAVEKVKVEVMGSFDRSGKLDLEELKKNLQKVEGLENDITGQQFPITVIVDGQQITVQKNGTVENKESNPITFNPETLTIGEATRTSEYGRKVKEYNIRTEQSTNDVWRLFYQDSNYTYLITEELADEYILNTYISNYTNGADVSIVGQRLSQKIKALFTETNTNSNIRATAWLTDTEVWKDYKNEDAVFAMRRSNCGTIRSIL